MPRATVDASSTTKFDLKSLADAYVVMRKQTYGERQRRADIVTRVTMQAAEQRGAPDVMQMDVRNLDVTLFDFRTSIIEHNLEDADGRALNFQNSNDLENLDPQVGDEIESLIRDMNRFDQEGRLADLDDFRRQG
jgi:hypothetical protein